MTLGGHVLPCGCLVGTYETWEGGVVDVLDAHDDRCHEAAHADNAIVSYSHAADASQPHFQSH